MQGKRVFPHEDKPMDVQYGRIGYECQFGKERNAAAKRKYRRKLEEKEKLVSSLFKFFFIHSIINYCFQNLTQKSTR